MWSIFYPKDIVMNHSQHFELTNYDMNSGSMEFSEKWNNTNKKTIPISGYNPGDWDLAAYYEGNIMINYLGGE